MAVLNFTLSEDSVAVLRDALICLNKFSDDVSLEARKDSVSNSSHLAGCSTDLGPVHPYHPKQLQIRLRVLQVRD